MELICFPFERVVEINTFILINEPGMQGTIDIPKLQGALSRIDNAIVYNGLDDVFEIAAKYTTVLMMFLRLQLNILQVLRYHMRYQMLIKELDWL